MGWCFGGFGDVVRSGCECLRPLGLRVVRQMSDILCGDAIVLKVAQDYILILGIALDKENMLLLVFLHQAVLLRCAACQFGPAKASIATLNARFEGMARTVGRHYPYFNSALTKKLSLNQVFR